MRRHGGPSSSAITSSISPCTGTTSRRAAPGRSTRDSGSARSPRRTTRTRSYGACSGSPSTSGVAASMPAQRRWDAARLRASEGDQVRHDLQAAHLAGRADQVREERGGPARPAADVEHLLAVAHVQQPEHPRHGARLGAGLAVADRSGPSCDARSRWSGGRKCARGVASNAAVTGSIDPGKHGQRALVVGRGLPPCARFLPGLVVFVLWVYCLVDVDRHATTASATCPSGPGSYRLLFPWSARSPGCWPGGPRRPAR